MARSIEKQVSTTYFALRVAGAVLAFSLPLMLWWGGKLAFHIPLRPSMSDYYWASTDFISPPCEPPPIGS